MTPENPYPAPTADAVDPSSEIPDEILKKIRNAWVAAVVSGCLTLVVILLAMAGFNILGFSAWELIDVALVFGLAFGIYKKNRICAVVMFVYFVASKIFMAIDGGGLRGVPMAIVFGYFFWQGVSGTFAYHKHRKSSSMDGGGPAQVKPPEFLS